MLNGSVDGVMTAERTSKMRTAYLRKERILSGLATPSLARMNITTGSWNARPSPSISVRKKVMTALPSGVHSIEIAHEAGEERQRARSGEEEGIGHAEQEEQHHERQREIEQPLLLLRQPRDQESDHLPHAAPATQMPMAM